MRNPLLAVLIAALLSFNASAQIEGVKEYTPQLDEATGIWKELIENQDNQRSIAAVHATFHCPVKPTNTQSGKYITEVGTMGEYDALTYAILDAGDAYPGIPPGSGSIITAADPVNCSGGVDAVIFSSGQSAGDSHWVNEFRQRWSGSYEAVIQSLPLLSKVANQKADDVEAVDFLCHRMELIPRHPVFISGAFDSKAFYERGVYFLLGQLLGGSNDPNADCDGTTNPRPRTKEQQRKAAVFLVGKLQIWKTALENVLKPAVAQ